MTLQNLSKFSFMIKSFSAMSGDSWFFCRYSRSAEDLFAGYAWCCWIKTTVQWIKTTALSIINRPSNKLLTIHGRLIHVASIHIFLIKAKHGSRLYNLDRLAPAQTISSTSVRQLTGCIDTDLTISGPVCSSVAYMSNIQTTCQTSKTLTYWLHMLRCHSLCNYMTSTHHTEVYGWLTKLVIFDSSITNSAVPRPARATPFTNDVDAPSPIPNENSLRNNINSLAQTRITYYNQCGQRWAQ